MARLYISGNAVDQNEIPVIGAKVYVRAGGADASLEDADGAALERIVERIPLSRLGTPADIASAVRYLLTADYVTGAELVVDGGRLAQ